MQVRTSPKERQPQVDGSEPNPGRFFDQQQIKTVSGETTVVEFKYIPFDAMAFQGSGNASVTVLSADGKPAAGKRAKIGWSDGHYGSIDVFDGAVPDDGVLKLSGVSLKARADTPYGPYSVTLEDDTIGFFRLEETDAVQEFTFRSAPEAGDAAPDFAFVDLKSGQTHHLSNLKGKIVLVEFWATWCGPCKPAMAKLVETYAARREDWKESVTIVALSTDETKELAVRHIEERGWDSMPQYWAERESGERLSKGEQAYVVHGIPSAVLIDADGTIAWRGHPMAKEEDVDLAGRIEGLRKQ